MEIKKENRYILNISESEFLWLKGMMQNSFIDEDEDEIDKNMRSTFWHTLNSIKKEIIS